MLVTIYDYDIFPNQICIIGQYNHMTRGKNVDIHLSVFMDIPILL